MFNYDNIGGKIKGLAKACFTVETIAAIITGIGFMVADSDLVLVGLLVMVFGPIVAWVSSWLLYGFGELIEKACEIADNTRGDKKEPHADAPTPEPQSTTPSHQATAFANPDVDPQRLAKLHKLREQGLITEEEFQRAIAKEA